MTPATWNHELTSTGEVRLPIRRHVLIPRLAMFLLMATGAGLSVIAAIRGSVPWGFWEILFLITLPMTLALCYRTASSMITGRPEIVDDGVTFGKERLTWPEIASIRQPRFPPWVEVTIVPREDPRARTIELTRDNLQYPIAVAQWLDSMLEQHRSAADEPRS